MPCDNFSSEDQETSSSQHVAARSLLLMAATASSSLDCATATETNSKDDNNKENNGQKINLGGRPKGSTIKASKEQQQLIINARNYAAKCHDEEKKKNGAKLPCFTLNKIIEETNNKYGLEEGQLKKSTLKGRNRKGHKQFTTGPGVDSPMLKVEKTIVEFIIRKAANREPYCIKDCIELANSLINKYVTQ